MDQEKKPEEEKVETQLEQLPDTKYKKDYVTFVIKPLHIDICHRWAKWCDDRGLGKNHNHAFALVLDIIENKTNELINSDARLSSMEKLLGAHDNLIKILLDELALLKEEPDVDESKEKMNSIVEKVRQKREKMGGKRK